MVVSTMLGHSLSKIYEEIISQEELHRSYHFFYGDFVILYGGIKEQKSKNIITCDFSGAIIYPKSSYIKFRPILENITKNEVYVLKRTLKVESGYQDKLPNNIQELETLQRNIRLENDSNDGIDYSHLSQRTGKELVLKKLRKGAR